MTALALAASVPVMLGCGPKTQSTQLSSGQASATREETTGELGRLTGRWQRPDGGYVLEIAGVADDGQVPAAYFNPSPIHVSTAKAEIWRGAAQLFVEFDDVNYRGSTYQLVHEPERDVLHGTYYQATMGQTFEVVFVRLR
jgi:hypothetical protein